MYINIYTYKYINIEPNIPGPATNGLGTLNMDRTGFRGPDTDRIGFRGPDTDRTGFRGPVTDRTGFRGPDTDRTGVSGPDDGGFLGGNIDRGDRPRPSTSSGKSYI
jgi:hypothetical protein